MPENRETLELRTALRDRARSAGAKQAFSTLLQQARPGMTGSGPKSSTSTTAKQKGYVMIDELAFIAYYVQDISKAAAFYRDVLGLRQGELCNDEWVEFDVGNATFALDGTGEALGIAAGSSSGAAFETKDIDAMRERLIEAGAAISEVYDFPPCRAAFARDPEGNRFIVHQRKTGLRD